MARPPKGEDLVDKYEGSPSAKERLRIILQTISGKKSVLEACEELGVSKTRFHEIRSEALLGALSSLEPSPVGRPPKEEEALPSDVEALKAEVKRLKKEVIISRVQAVLEVAPPEFMESQEPPKKKKKRRKKRKK